jgi:peptide chain release factor 1
MWDRLVTMDKRLIELEGQMATPQVAADPEQLRKLGQERASIEDIVTRYRQYRATEKNIEETRALLRETNDEEMKNLAKDELSQLEPELERRMQELRLSLLPHDPNDEKHVIIEIRSGTGGDEAGLFAADLYRMYSRYAQNRHWETEVITSSDSGLGGFKEIIFEVNGKGAYSRFKYERGVHRVQRVPATEASGRIHTSTATVAVLPEADELEIDIKQSDLRIDIYHSGGAGGQNVNKVATAVRLTHLPTGMVVICQDERSQLKNKNKAMAVLRARLMEGERVKREEAEDKERRSQVGSAERAEKIRTYNFPQDRLTDHRIGLTMHNLPRIMSGDLDALIDALATEDQARQLSEQLA